MNQAAKDDREIADQRRQDDVLQSYLDQIGQLLLDKDRPLRQSEQGDEARTLARARTLTALRRLNGERKGTLVQFLYEARLIRGAEDLDEDLVELVIAFAAGADPIKDDEEEAPNATAGQPAVVSLSGADLRDTNLRDAILWGIDLSGSDLRGADLAHADLTGALLNGTDLQGVDLSNATLIDASLGEANLRNASLRGSYLRRASLHSSDLRGADLRDANFRDADLTFVSFDSADLSITNLIRADLNCANGLTEEQLHQVQSLDGATMPDGTKHP